MRFINYYDKLAEKDIKKLKADIIWWVENNQDAILLFDTPIIRDIRRRMKEQEIQQCIILGYSKNKVVIEDIIIEWHNVGGKKAILKSVKDETGRALYEQPSSWKDSELWYQFK